MRRITVVFLILSHTVEEGFLPAKTVTVPEHNITKISKTPPFSSGHDRSSIVGTQSS